MSAQTLGRTTAGAENKERLGNGLKDHIRSIDPSRRAGAGNGNGSRGHRQAAVPGRRDF